MNTKSEVRSGIIGWAVAAVLGLIVAGILYTLVPKTTDVSTQISSQITARLRTFSARSTPPISFTIQSKETPVQNSDQLLGNLFAVTGTISSKGQPEPDVEQPADDINSYIAIFGEQKTNLFKYLTGNTKEYVLQYLGATDLQSTLSKVEFLPLGSAETETVWVQIARSYADRLSEGFFLLQGQEGKWQVQACPKMKINWSKVVSPTGFKGGGPDDGAAVFDTESADPIDTKQAPWNRRKVAPIEMFPNSIIKHKDISTTDDPHTWEIVQQFGMIEQTQPYAFIMSVWMISSGKCDLAYYWNDQKALIRNAKDFKKGQDIHDIFASMYDAGRKGTP
jgi:hypothetical protein